MEIFDGLEKAVEKYRSELAPDLSSEVVQGILEAVTNHSTQSVQLQKTIQQIVDGEIGPRPVTLDD